MRSIAASMAELTISTTITNIQLPMSKARSTPVLVISQAAGITRSKNSSSCRNAASDLYPSRKPIKEITVARTRRFKGSDAIAAFARGHTGHPRHGHLFTVVRDSKLPLFDGCQHFFLRYGKRHDPRPDRVFYRVGDGRGRRDDSCLPYAHTVIRPAR